MRTHFTRREWLSLAAALAGGCTTPPSPDAGSDAASPDATPDALASDVTSLDAVAPPAPIAALDDAMTRFMAARAVPGGALAVVRRGRLVYLGNYGAVDRTAGAAPVRSTSRFRIASLSKAFTSAAVLQLVEAGTLTLDAPVLPLLGIVPFVAAGGAMDPRVATITARQLLQHTGGWDRDVSSDPMFQSRLIAAALGVASPPGPRDIVRYMLGRRLDFDPGARYAYSNFGYCLLGRLVEQLTGRAYADYVRDHVLLPSGITTMLQGQSLLAGRGADEVGYAMPPGSALADSVFDTAPGQVPWPYGGWCIESMDSHGAWVASVVDLARWCAALDDVAHSPVLQPASFSTMYARPAAPAWRNADGSLTDYFYGCGWLVRPVTGGANYWHDGSLDGTASYLVRRADGLSWATLFNQRSTEASLPDSDIDGAVNAAINTVTTWPDVDLFPPRG